MKLRVRKKLLKRPKRRLSRARVGFTIIPTYKGVYNMFVDT